MEPKIDNTTLIDIPVSFMTGKTIAHYEILDKIGEGGMGIVYKARDTKLNRTVALKFLPSNITPSHEREQRFIQEAITTASMNHPHICTIYSFEEHKGQQFISMEYVDGITLRDKLETGNPTYAPKSGASTNRQKSETLPPETGNLKLETAIDYAIQIAKGLAESHEKGIIHRDIKPENIMVDSQNRIKVMDFGVAKLKGSMNITKSGRTVGTVRYMSPEQIQGEDVDHRTDIWSFGAVLYELLTGHAPFHGEYEAALLYRILNESPPSLSRYRNDIPGSIEKCINRMLEKEPDARYDSFVSIIADLRNMSGTKSFETISKPVHIKNGKSVAVIDFQNITGHDDDAWLSGGIAETVIVDLSKISSLRVVSRERTLKTIARYSEGKLSDRQVIDIGKQLRVRWVVWGAYQKMGDRIRITAHFTDVPTGDLLNSTKVDGAMNDIFDLQDTIIINLKDTLNVKIPSGELHIIKQPQTDKVTAYEYYATGRQLFYKFDPKSLVEARTYFEKAIEIDPDYALAYSGLGTTYIFHFIAHTDPGDLEIGMKHLIKALEIDPNIAEPHHFLGYAYFRKKEYHTGAYHGQRAIELDPDSYFGHYFLGANFMSHAYLDYKFELLNESIKHFKLSRELEPDYQWNHLFLSLFTYLFGQYEQSLRYAQSAIELGVTKQFKCMRCISMYPIPGFIFIYQGKFDAARESFQNSLSTIESLEHVYKYPTLALTYCGLGDVETAAQNYSDALKFYHNAIEIVSSHPTAVGIGRYMVRVKCGLAKLFYSMGMRKEAEENFLEALTLFEQKDQYDFNFIFLGLDAELAYELSTYYAFTKQNDKALGMLNKAVKEGWRNYLLPESNEVFRFIRTDTEFINIISSLKEQPLPSELDDDGDT